MSNKPEMVPVMFIESSARYNDVLHNLGPLVLKSSAMLDWYCFTAPWKYTVLKQRYGYPNN